MLVAHPTGVANEARFGAREGLIDRRTEVLVCVVGRRRVVDDQLVAGHDEGDADTRGPGVSVAVRHLQRHPAPEEVRLEVFELFDLAANMKLRRGGMIEVVERDLEGLPHVGGGSTTRARPT